MITENNKVFHLQGKGFSCLLRITEQGLPEQLHFGAPVRTADAAALACKPGLGWGTSLVQDGVCPDVLPLAWSGSGRGDYRESPLEVACDGAAVPTDLRYVNHRIYDGICPMEGGLPQARHGGQTLEITLAQADGLRLVLIWTVFDTALTRRVRVENGTGHAVTLHKVMSFSMDLPGAYALTAFDGGWIAEMRRSCVPVGASRITRESTTGFSSNRHQPGFLLSEPEAGEEHGCVYGFNLVYSGNHYASAQRSLQGLTRVMQGMGTANLSLPLPPGGCLETPEAVLAWSDRGFNGLSHRMHRFVTDHIVPSYWRCRPRPVLFNSWEGCMFDFTHSRLLALAKQAAKLGCELFVLDDGWFGERDHDRAGLGDYTVNRKKLPHGLDGLGRAVNELGLQFGLWFEPEAVNPDSELYRAHPDWALTDDFPPAEGRNELLLDLTKPQVRDYIVNAVSQVLDSAPITYVKWDMNRHSAALGAKAHAYILGLYEVLRRIFVPRPQILLESCASGGNRFDLGMLCFSPQIWCSDNTDPIERLEIQNSLSYLYPQSTFGAHVSAAPHAQTLRTTPLSTRGNVSFFGVLGYELDLKHLLPVEEREIRSQIAVYKQFRRLFQFGRFRRLPVEEGVGWQVSRGSLHGAGIFRRLVAAAPGYERLRLIGLKPAARYRVENRTQQLRVGQFGALVKHIAPVDLDPNGPVLRTVDRRYAMEDGHRRFSAGGAALQAGIMTTPRFTGTGYDKDLRVQGDFSSYLYLVQEESDHGKAK